MKKLVLLSLLAIAGLSMAAEVRYSGSALLSPDIPPPSCAPDCPLAR